MRMERKTGKDGPIPFCVALALPPFPTPLTWLPVSTKLTGVPLTVFQNLCMKKSTWEYEMGTGNRKVV